MAVDVVMPQMGVSVSEGTISRWVKGVGEAIEADETIVEISTDKVDTEVPSPGAGVITEILHQEGETVPVGTRIAVIGGEAAMAEASAQAVAGAASSNDAVALEADGPPTVPAPSPEAPGTAPESPAAAATAQAASGSVDAAPAVASEPAYVVGTATMGRPVVSATALASPVVDPPPTETRASTSCSAAAARARSATATGTCIATSWCHRATGTSAATRSARSFSGSAAITMVRE